VRKQASWRIFVTVLLGALSAGTLWGHHSFSMFDTTKTITLTGTVTSFQWTNPHAYIEIDVPQAGGAVKPWSVEMGSPSILQQGGWTFKAVKAGDKVTVDLQPLRNGDPGGLLVKVTLPDGRVLGNGPGRGPAAPTAGRGAPAPAPASTPAGK